jgi:hypothetical protein
VELDGQSSVSKDNRREVSIFPIVSKLLWQEPHSKGKQNERKDTNQISRL